LSAIVAFESAARVNVEEPDAERLAPFQVVEEACIWDHWRTIRYEGKLTKEGKSERSGEGGQSTHRTFLEQLRSGSLD
jgi:hypothetical protein